MRKLDTELNAS